MGDPLNNVHSDVFDSIFQHLSWGDLSTLSTVCKSWYEAIAESRQCMDKVEVKISNFSRHLKSDQRSSLQPLHESKKFQRNYRHIIADFSDHSRFQILQILKPEGRLWKNVHLLNANFVNEKFALNFCDSVVLLTLTRVQCNFNIDSLNLTFPRLKELNLMTCNENVMKIFGNCSGLQKLHVSASKDCQNVSEILVKNEDLEDLSICAPDFSQLFSTEVIKKVKFKLKKIAIESYEEFTRDDKKSLKLFVETQSPSLEVVYLNPWCGTEIIETCWRMKRLVDISFNLNRIDEEIDWNRVSFPINPTIQRINLCDVSKYENATFYEAIFKSAPNLKVFKSKCIQAEEFHILSSRCKQLRELYIEEFNISFLPTDSLPNIDKFKSWDVNDDLLKTLKSKIARNRFEDKILMNG